MRRSVYLLAAALVALSASRARAAPILTNDVGEVLAVAEHVVRGTIHHDTKKLTIKERLRGEIAADEIVIENHFVPLFRWWPITDRRQAPPPIEGVFFLQELDGRFYMPETRAPAWITPHSGVRYLAQSGKVVFWGQMMNPGRLCLMPDRWADHDAFLTDLRGLVEAQPFRGTRADALGADEAKRFYGLVDPLEYHARRLVPPQARRTGEQLEALIRESSGLLRRRAVDAFLMLARRDVEHFAHEAWVDAKVRKMLHDLGVEPFASIALEELARGDVWVNMTTMGRILRIVGGDAEKKGLEILERWVLGEASSMGTHAYWALVYTGRKSLADRLLAEREDR